MFRSKLAVPMLYISLRTVSSSVWLSCIPCLLFFLLCFPPLSPALRSSVPLCGWCRCVEWRSLGLVRRTSPSPRAVRGVALSTRPPIPLSTMTLLLPLPAGQTLPKAHDCTHTHAHKTHTMHALPSCTCYIVTHIHEFSFHSLHQLFTVENLHDFLSYFFYLHDMMPFHPPSLLWLPLLSLAKLWTWPFSFHACVCPFRCLLFALCDSTSCESWVWLVTLDTWWLKFGLHKVSTAVLCQWWH